MAWFLSVEPGSSVQEPCQCVGIQVTSVNKLLGILLKKHRKDVRCSVWPKKVHVATAKVYVRVMSVVRHFQLILAFERLPVRPPLREEWRREGPHLRRVIVAGVEALRIRFVSFLRWVLLLAACHVLCRRKCFKCSSSNFISFQSVFGKHSCLFIEWVSSFSCVNPTCFGIERMAQAKGRRHWFPTQKGKGQSNVSGKGKRQG